MGLAGHPLPRARETEPAGRSALVPESLGQCSLVWLSPVPDPVRKVPELIRVSAEGHRVVVEDRTWLLPHPGGPESDFGTKTGRGDGLRSASPRVPGTMLVPLLSCISLGFRVTLGRQVSPSSCFPWQVRWPGPGSAGQRCRTGREAALVCCVRVPLPRGLPWAALAPSPCPAAGENLCHHGPGLFPPWEV